MTIAERIQSFARNEDGISEDLYNLHRDRIVIHLGKRAARALDRMVEQKGDKICIKPDIINAWSMICIAAGPIEWSEHTDDSGQVILYTGHDDMGREVED